MYLEFMTLKRNLSDFNKQFCSKLKISELQKTCKTFSDIKPTQIQLFFLILTCCSYRLEARNLTTLDPNFQTKSSARTEDQKRT